MVDDFYVYALFRETGEPFYIGKGRKNRWKQHVYKNKLIKNTYKTNLVAKLVRDCGECIATKIAENLTERIAHEVEIAFIKALGRYPNGPLLNLTDGGEGCANPSPESVERMVSKKRGKKYGPCSELTKKKIRDGLLNSGFVPKHSESSRLKISNSLLKIWARPGEKERRKTSGMTGKKHSLETISRMQAAAKGRKLSQETKFKIGVASIGRIVSQETRNKMSRSQIGRTHSEETRQKISRTKIEKFSKNG